MAKSKRAQGENNRLDKINSLGEEPHGKLNVQGAQKKHEGGLSKSSGHLDEYGNLYTWFWRASTSTEHACRECPEALKKLVESPDVH